MKFYTISTETKKSKFIGGITNGRKCYIFDKKAEFFDYILSLSGVCFVHNLDYFAKFLFSYLNKKNIVIEAIPKIDPFGNVIYFKVNNLVFKDSLTLLNDNLKNLAVKYKLKRQVKEINFENQNKEQLKDCLKNNTLILHRLITKFWEFVGWEFFNKRTLSSISLAKLKTINPDSYDKIIGTPIWEEEEKFIRQGFFTSYSKIFNHSFKKKDGEEIIKADFNGFYPYVMRENEFPYGKHFYYLQDKGEETIEDKLGGDELGIVECEAIIPDNLPLDLGFLPYYNTEKGEIEFPFEKDTKIMGVYTSKEILYAQKLGYRFTYKKALFWKEKCFLFRKYMDFLFKIRKEEAGYKKDIVKRLAVLLYGKFGVRRLQVIYKDVKEWCINKFFLKDLKNKNLTAENVYIRLPYSHPEIAVFTTSFARIYFYSFLQEYLKETERNTTKIFAIMADALIFNTAYLSNEFKKKWFSQEKIGKLKEEAKITSAEFGGQGVYTLITENGKDIIKKQGRKRT